MKSKKVKTMQLPSNCKCLNTQEMMMNESGWYVNFNTGELFLTYRDIDSTVRWVTSFIEDVAQAMAMDSGCIQSEIAKNRPPHIGPHNDRSAGLGIRINKDGFKFFALNEEELKLANSNTFIF